jgi:RNA polymerase sigma-B factor
MPRLQQLAALDAADPRYASLRDELIVAFLPVVDHLVRKYRQAEAVEDLTQVGRFALIKAIDAWDPHKAHGEFLGYLIPCVRGELLRWFRDQTWAVHVPRRLKELGTRINGATGPLSQQLGRAPRPSELAAHLDADVHEVIEALTAQANRSATPLDAADHGEGAPRADRLGDIDRALEGVEYRETLRPLLAELPERERAVIMLRFFGERSQYQIAEELGISQMHVSRLLARTVADLRRGLADVH